MSSENVFLSFAYLASSSDPCEEDEGSTSLTPATQGHGVHCVHCTVYSMLPFLFGFGLLNLSNVVLGCRKINYAGIVVDKFLTMTD